MEHSSYVFSWSFAGCSRNIHTCMCMYGVGVKGLGFIYSPVYLGMVFTVSIGKKRNPQEKNRTLPN